MPARGTGWPKSGLDAAAILADRAQKADAIDIDADYT